MTRFLLSLDSKSSSNFFLSERIPQDSLENYFGKQRTRGGRNKHPDLNQCVINASGIRLQKSLALNPVRGNSRRKRLTSEKDELFDSVTLKKRKRQGRFVALLLSFCSFLFYSFVVLSCWFFPPSLGLSLLSFPPLPSFLFP